MFDIRLPKYRRGLVVSVAVLALVGLALAMVACSAGSPSEPDQPAGTTPTPDNAVWNITLNLSSPEVPAGSTDAITVRVRVVRRDNGQPPANGTTVVMTASAGTFSSNVIALNNGQGVATYTPPAQQGSGTVTLQARLEGDVGQALLRILEPATFFIGSLQPNSGSPNGGDQVAIVGGGFEAPVRVTFGGVPAQVLSVASNRIRVETPPSATPVSAGQTAVVSVSVTTNLNTTDEQTDTLNSGFTYALGGGPPTQPAVTSVTPASGPNEGGTRVTINGEGFQSPVQVFFGQGASAQGFTGVEATVESVSSSRIVVTSPPATGFGQNNLNQVVDLLVKNLGTGFATVAQSAFQYGAGGADVPFVSAIAPSQGPYSGGTLVTVYGQGFDAPVAVEMGGVGQQIVSVTGTEIVIRTVAVDVTSCADVTGATMVTNVETGESATGPDFRYRVPQPVVTGVSPGSGSANGGTTVTISGQGFSSPLRVLFGDQAASVQSVSSDGTQIVVTTPTFSGDLNTEACGDGGERFVPTAVDVQMENLVTTCDDTFSQGFVFNPSDTSCRNETPPEPTLPECSDGIDNDNDGLTDYNMGISPPGDPECTSDGDNSESS